MKLLRALLPLLLASAALAQVPQSNASLHRDPVFGNPYLRPAECNHGPAVDKGSAAVFSQVLHTLLQQSPLTQSPGFYYARVSYIVDAAGVPREVQWVDTNNLAYAQACIQATSALHYAPAQFNGRSVPCCLVRQYRMSQSASRIMDDSPFRSF